ncbi:MAG TPA: GTPase HflX [Acidimicrobiales bacterium]
MALIDRSFREKIVLVGMTTPPDTTEDTEASMDELELLVETAGADTAARVVQRRAAPDPKYYIGKGKAEELREVALATDCDTVVFDDELTPAQQFNLEKLLGRTAIDRTAVILDIFAQNASSLEGKAQVQLAQYRYRLPRLRGSGARLSQQAGGIGTRSGPGETQFEIDRRRIQRNITHLERQLRDVRRQRATKHKARHRSRIPQVALVGYTNAGKSTLLNHLTDAGVLVEDRLFATLDPTTRRLELPGGSALLLTDTVGFVRKLPHQVVEAFKATLELVAEADIVVHLVDATAADPLGQIDAVRVVLEEIGAGAIPEILAFNKADQGPAETLAAAHPGSVAISARSGTGMGDLLRAVADRLHAGDRTVELLVPFDRGDVLAAAHRLGEVLVEEPGEGGILVRARLDSEGRSRLADYRIDGGDEPEPDLD